MILSMALGYLILPNSTIKANGNKVLSMATDIIRIKLTTMFMSDNSIKESNKEKVELFTVTAQSTMANSVIKYLGELAISNTLTRISTLDNLMKEKSMVRETIFSVRVQYLQEAGKTIIKFKAN